MKIAFRTDASLQMGSGHVMRCLTLADARQGAPKAYHDAGQFYWGRTDAWLQGRMIFSPAAAPVMLPRHRVQDIDTPEDWTRAE